MFISQQRERVSALVREYPRAFWTLTAVTFIDHVGGAVLFPFFALYITHRFSVGMTEVGILFAFFSISGFVGSMLGGALTDRLGRKGMIIFGLLATSLSTLIMGFVDSLEAFYVLALVAGVFTDIGGPAQQAMVADLLPERQRAQGFGILRVALNVSVSVGPAIGGFLAARSYLLIFIADAVASLITAALVLWKLLETRPESSSEGQPESVRTTFRGYFTVLRDGPFLSFLGANLLLGLVYMNLNTTLGVYLRDEHGVPTSGYGMLISINAIMVVAMQFWITRRVSKFPPMLMMAMGSVLYAVGFGMYGVVGVFAFFVVAMAVLTLGEMVVAPVSQALVAELSPEDMRGRYMAVFGISWMVPFAAGPYLAGLILDGSRPANLWLVAGLIGFAAGVWFLRLHSGRTAKRQDEKTLV